MDILNKVKGWASALADLGISLIALMLVVEVIGLGAIPFFPEVSIISNVSGMLSALGNEGLMGLVAIWVLYSIWNKK